MNCDDVRPLLPLFVYDDLETALACSVESHVAECAACSAEHAALAQTRRALDQEPPVAVRLDPFELLRAETRQAHSSSRRWRRAAVALSALAAGLLLVLALKVQVRAGDGQFAIVWGDLPPAKPVPANTDAGVAERLQLVQELTRALVSELESRDGATRNELMVVKDQLAAMQRLVTQRWTETERDIAALYKTTFSRPETGEK